MVLHTHIGDGKRSDTGFFLAEIESKTKSNSEGIHHRVTGGLKLSIGDTAAQLHNSRNTSCTQQRPVNCSLWQGKQRPEAEKEKTQ